MIHPEDEEFLAHYGVRGMRWGVISNKDKAKSIQRINIDTHNKSVPALDKLGRQINKDYGGVYNKAGKKAYNKGTQKVYNKTLSKKVVKARADIKSGKLDAKKAKLQADYIKNKQSVGKKEAKKIFKKDSEKVIDTIMLSRQIITGKELTTATLKAAGLGIGTAAATAAAVVGGAAALTAYQMSQG